MEVVLAPQLLVARLGGRHRVASWALFGGGLRSGQQTVAWVEIRNADLPLSVDPRGLLEARLREHGLPDAIGLLTSRTLCAYDDVTCRLGDESARCVATVGLSNALRAGDAPREGGVGTINLLCAVSTPLSDEGLLEALALASEAKALAIREARVPSIASGEPSSGTGTDCIVVASPDADPAVAFAQYAGKHTALGHVIGASVREAVARGAARWQREQGPR